MNKVGDIKNFLLLYGLKNSINYNINNNTNFWNSWYNFNYQFFKDAYYNGNMIKIHNKWYKTKCQKSFDPNNLVTLSDKLQWIKLFENDKTKHLLSDKIESKLWASKILGEAYVPKLLRKWEDVKDYRVLDFRGLPKDFFMKFSHGSAFNFRVEDNKVCMYGKKYHPLAYHPLMTYISSIDFAFVSAYEMQYHQLKPVLFVEELLKKTKTNNYYGDYKFLCIDGKPYLFERYKLDKQGIEIYTTDLRYQIIGNEVVPCKSIKNMPKDYDKMLQIAKKLSVGFNFVRVDLLVNENRIYFGEMTFTPSSGILNDLPKDMDMYLASKVVINDN